MDFLNQKEIEKNLIELLEESLFKHEKYYDHDDTEYQEQEAANLFNQSTNKDYYKPIWTKSAFNGNYIEYERK